MTTFTRYSTYLVTTLYRSTTECCDLLQHCFLIQVVTVGVTIIQMAAMGLLSRLFLSRSLYWEVSTLSSTTLPLRLDRGGGGGIQGYLTKAN